MMMFLVLLTSYLFLCFHFEIVIMFLVVDLLISYVFDIFLHLDSQNGFAL